VIFSVTPGIRLEHHPRQYRSRIRIAADILEIVKDGSRKTRIMYQGNLSFDLVQKYLNMLASFGLVEAREGSEKTYIATEKGRRFLEDFHELEKHSEIVEEKRKVLEGSLTSTG
jgi:predicted transcriptional regulator